MAWESWNKIPIIMSWKAGKYTFYVKKHHMLKTASLKSGDKHVDKPLYSWTRCLEMMPKNHLHWSRMIPTRKLFIISDFYTHGSRSFFLFLYGLEWFPTLVFNPPLFVIIWYWYKLSWFKQLTFSQTEIYLHCIQWTFLLFSILFYIELCLCWNFQAFWVR